MPFDVLTSPFKKQIYKYIYTERKKKVLVLKNKSVGKVLLMVVFTREMIFKIIFWQRELAKQIFINHSYCTMLWAKSKFRSSELSLTDTYSTYILYIFKG